MDRLFLDGSVLFSAACRDDSGLLQLWELKDVELLTSGYALEEARRNLDMDEQLRCLEALVRGLRLVPESANELPDGVELSEKDVPIVQAAIAAQTSHLITGDRRDLGRVFGQQMGGVWVMTPREYLTSRKR